MKIGNSIAKSLLKATFASTALLLLSTNAFSSTQPYITSHQINFGTGNKYLSATDVRVAGPGARLAFTRTYNSQSTEDSVVGYGWSSSHTERLVVETGKITLIQAGGRHVHFLDDGNGNFINETGGRRVITPITGGYQLVEKSGVYKTYDSAGKITSFSDRNANTRTYSYNGNELTSITNNFGGTLSFTYTDGKLSSVTSMLGTFTYSYDVNGNLETVTKPDGAAITYIYDDPNDSHNLTGVINEEGERILTVEYDDADRAIRSAKQGGSNEVNISYPANYLRKITNSQGGETTYHLDVLYGIVKVSSFTGPGCSSCGSDSDVSYLYDNRFRVKEATDANGTTTAYTYDDNGNTLTRTVATGTLLEKQTTYTYFPDNKVHTITVDSVANPGQSQVTTMSYDASGNLSTKTESGYEGTMPLSRTTTYSYNSIGQITGINGPRTDVNDTVTMVYYPNDGAQGLNRGQLHTVTNAKDHVTTYADYNLHGQAETITDANGLVTTRVYNGRGLLTSSTTAGLITSYGYDSAGDLQTITRPGNRTITYGYDSAGRVNSITDNEGNSIIYSYDSEGRKTGEQINDPADTLMRFTNFEYNDSGHLSKMLLPGGAERTYDYDAVGNLVKTTNATGLQTDMVYDLLNRLESIAEDGDTTEYQYDANDNITAVTDSQGNTTSFVYDDFGRRISSTAPDTGTTTYSYDNAGNLETITDELYRTVGFYYDELNRPISQEYGTTTISFTYDENAHGKGRLSLISDEHGSRSFLYNNLGQLTNETRLIDGTSYTIDYGYLSSTGELASITYPSGMLVKYNRDSNGQVSSIEIDDTTIISAVTHLPFGPLQSATLGSTTLNRTYDQRYNLSSISAGSWHTSYIRDAEGHVTVIENSPAPVGSDATEDYTYDPLNNQLTAKDSTSYTYDAVGNMTSAGSFTFTYDELNRLVLVEDSGTIVATYGYDSSNRRIVKTVGAETTHYLYDASSNLIAEAQADGTISREYIYLNSELIAINDYQDTPGLYYVINDHLGTPQQLIEADGTVVWQAAYLPFGQAQVTINQVENNIRFPGQYFDAETGLHYNWNRFYDPSTGRYITADPIGLAGGMNLYAYAGGNPINNIDPKGLTFGTGKNCGCDSVRLWGPDQCVSVCMKKWFCDKVLGWALPNRCLATRLYCMVRCDNNECSHYDPSYWDKFDNSDAL